MTLFSLKEQITDKPLVTIAIVAYNQEKYIGEAVQGVFSQTYSPLEIIISDDCSLDSTFSIISELASSYRGPHKVVVNKTVRNCGIAGHLNQVVKMSTGELIVLSAGDDVSLPNRVADIAAKWVDEENFSGSIFAGTVETDEKLSALSKHFPKDVSEASGKIQLDSQVVVGASHAFTKSIWDKFGELPEKVVNEDMAIYFRSSIFGKVLTIKDALVLHRIHDNNLGNSGHKHLASPAEYKRFWKLAYERRASLIRCHLDDIAKVELSRKSAPLDEIKKELIAELRSVEFLLSQKSFSATTLLKCITRHPTWTIKNRVALFQANAPWLYTRLRQIARTKGLNSLNLTC